MKKLIISQHWFEFVTFCSIYITNKQNDETLLIINKLEHPKKGENKEQNGNTHVQEDKRTT